MANTIQIKRSTGTTAPTNLAAGELAHTQGGGTQANGGDRLYIGEGSNTQEVIGGKYFTDLLDHVHGVATSGSALITDDTTGALSILKTGTHATAAGTIEFREGTNNGSKSLILQGAADVGAADLTITLPTATDTLVGKATTDTFTNKTIDFGDTGNSITGSLAEFNAALQSKTFTTLEDAETISGVKTFTGNPVITEITSGSTITLNAETDIIFDANGADIKLKDDGADFGSLTNDGGELIIKSGTTTAATFSGANVTLAGTVGSGNITSTGSITSGSTFVIGSSSVDVTELGILDGATVTTTELNKLDGVTSTTAELSIVDGDSGTSSVTVVDGDKVIINDSGVMKQCAVTDLSAYFDDEITAMPNLVTTAATTVGALDSGSITSGFTSIDVGDGAITTTGAVTGGSAVVDNITINANTISTTNTNGSLVISPHGSGDIDADSSKIINVTDPTQAQDAATKAYVDATKQGLSVKDSVRAATTANITIATALNNGDTLDGVTLATGDRILVKNQSTGSENGIYVVAASPARAVDMDASSEIAGGVFTFTEEGTVNSDSGWVLTTDGAITLDTTSLSFTQFSGAGQITAGTGLTKTANTINAVGTANVITVSADAITIANTYAGQNSIVTVGDITAGEWKSIDVAVSYGGTGRSTFTSNGILYGNGTSGLNVTAAGADAYFLKSNNGTPVWSNVIDGGTF